jgi:2-phosphosulfolactate phosphatase
MSFSTCVTTAVARGARVFPYRWKDESALAFARSVGAELAGGRSRSGYSLSPCSLLQIPAGTRLVLPSPNGATLTLATGATPTFAGCLRNATAVAQAAMRCGSRIAVIPAGERWHDDGSLRIALEDMLGAGAIISHLTGSLSPEARLAADAFRSAGDRLLELLRECNSGRELIARGFAEDVTHIAQVDADDCAPRLRDGAYGVGAGLGTEDSRPIT